MVNQQHINAITLNGYFHMRHNVAYANIFSAFADKWKTFQRQPMAVKARHAFVNDTGYEYKSASASDFKENFHLTRGYQTPPKATQIDVEFLEYGKSLLDEITPLVQSIAQVISAAGKFDITSMVMGMKDQWVLRCLRYFPRTMAQIEANENLLAVPHADQGLTIRIYEDGAGFEVLWNGEWIAVDPNPNCLMAYPGLVGQYYSDCRLPALCHRVVSNHETELRGRNSIVIFIGFGEVEYDSRNGRIKDRFAYGENYLMPVHEFKQLFIPRLVPAVA